MRVFIYSIHGFDKEFLENSFVGKFEIASTEKALDIDTVEMCKSFDAVALFSNDNASSEVLEKLAAFGVKYISLRSVGYDHVNLETAKALGIKVANVPEYSPYAIAEHAVAMLLMLNRKLYEAQLLIQMQDYRLDALVGFDLHGKTVGVVGTGKIGFAFAKIMNGFGCKLLAFDPEQNPKAADINMQYTSFENLIEQSDIISLNCPLNENTKYLFSDKEFSKMKQGSIMINTARGGVINTSSLIKYLENGHLGGACLDVYEKEKGLFFYDHRKSIFKDEIYARLLSFKNVLITGHQAFLTQEAIRGIAETTAYNLEKWKSGQNSENELN